MNDLELARAKTAIKEVEANLVAKDKTLDTDAIWQTATEKIAGNVADRERCRREYVDLVNMAPPSTIKKDF